MAVLIANNSNVEKNLNYFKFSSRKKVHSIGRLPENDLVFSKSILISRFHGKLFNDNGSWSIWDAKSGNGIYVNNIKIPSSEKYTLNNGALIVFDYRPNNEEPLYSFKFQIIDQEELKDNEEYTPQKTIKLNNEIIDLERIKYNEKINQLQNELNEKEELLKRSAEETQNKYELINKERENIFNNELSKLRHEMEREKLDAGDLSRKVQLEYEKKIKETEENFISEKNRIIQDKKLSEKQLTDTIDEIKIRFEAEKQEINNELYKAEKKIKLTEAEQIRTKNELEDAIKLLSSQIKQSDEEKTKLKDLLEDELICSICSEIFICPMSLQCQHTFCALCIYRWIKHKNECPQCRKPITSKTNSLPVQNYIDKVVVLLSKEMKERRSQLLKERVVETEEFNASMLTNETKTDLPERFRNRNATNNIRIRNPPQVNNRMTQIIDLTGTSPSNVRHPNRGRYIMRRGRPY